MFLFIRIMKICCGRAMGFHSAAQRLRSTNNLRVIPHAWLFLVWVKFSVYGVQVECRCSVAHTLMRRYNPKCPFHNSCMIKFLENRFR
ncbi:hypothetical protein C9J40_06330 [Photobacterium sp. GB-72]|nr:hypothetical protein C9J40_06330 [Photobacterium sp. GB-72]